MPFLHPRRGNRPHSETWFNGVVLIDLHRLARHPILWRVFQVKDLANWFSPRKLTVLAPPIACLLAGLPGSGCPRHLGGAVFARLVQWKWQRYRRHNLKLDKGVRRAA